MRGRVSAVVLLSFLAASTALPQCNYTSAFSGSFRSSYLDVATSSSEIWSATGYGVQVFDSAGRFLQTIAVPGATRVVVPAPALGAYAGSGSGIYLITGAPGSMRISGSADAGATVNDIIVTPNYLYAATSNGLLQFDLLNPAAPARTQAVLSTTSPNVTSLALSGSTLYAADGDNTVEIFDLTLPTLPQRVGQLQSLPRSNAVHLTSTRIYISDGQNTDVFIRSGASTTKVATEAYGTTALAPLGGEVVFAAGTDRRIHALDWTNADQPVEIFATDILPTGGSINRAGAMAVAGNSLLIAAGDAGLLTYDVGGFTAPYSVRSYGTGATSSVIWAAGKLYAARTAGGISEFTKSSSGALTAARQWDARVHTLHDSNGDGFLLSSTGPLLTYWTLTSSSPTLVSSATFKSAIVSAVAVGFTAWVVLDDHSVWQADLSQQAPVPTQLAGTSATSIARSGNGVAWADLRTDGTTAVSTLDAQTQVRTIIVPGSATTRVAFSGSKASVFTFRGINVIDFATGSVTVLPQSNTDIAEGLAFRGSQLLELTESAVRVWDPLTGSVVREFPLPVSGTALAAEELAAIATPSGVTAVLLDSSSTAPALVSARGGNKYYKKIAAAGDRLYLFDSRAIDIFSTTTGATPHYVGSIQAPGLVDFAVSVSNVFAVSNSRVVTAWSRDGVPLAQTTLAEGSDVQPLAIGTAAGAPWISISKGCLSGACQKQTLVLDPRSLVRTSVLDGAAVDVTGAGSRAWAVFDLPASIRTYDVSDPLHPSPLASRATEGATTPVSVAESKGTLYVLGEKLYSYDETSLTKTSEQFSSYQPDLGGAFAYVDQRVRVDGGCAFVSGRSASPQLFAVPQWTAAASPAVPASVRSVAAVPGRLYLLTDDSVEIWTTQPISAPSRRRATR